MGAGPSPGQGSPPAGAYRDQHRDPVQDPDSASVGELLSKVTADLSLLMRQELELAKTEIKQEVSQAAKGAGLFAGAGFAGYMLAVLGSLAIAYGIGSQIGYGWGTAIVTVVWALIGLTLLLLGRTQLRRVHAVPPRTAQTMKEDAQWARHPRS